MGWHSLCKNRAKTGFPKKTRGRFADQLEKTKRSTILSEILSAAADLLSQLGKEIFT
jgi:hypothetical protein